MMMTKGTVVALIVTVDQLFVYMPQFLQTLTTSGGKVGQMLKRLID